MYLRVASQINTTDVFNIVSLKDQEMMDAFDKTYNPRNNIISHDDGRVDRRLMLIKDQMVGLYLFNNV